MSKKPVDTKFYDLLGVKPNASESEIKTAFRKMALKWHPDKWVNSSEQEKAHAEATFKELSEATSILLDPEKRDAYDQFGEDAFKGNGCNGHAHGHGINPEDLAEFLSQMGMGGMHFGGGMGGMHFGGGMGGMPFGFGGRSQKKKGVQFPNISHVIKTTIAETYVGKQVVFSVTRYNLVEGKQPKKEDLVCDSCKGEGKVIKLIQIGPGMMQQSAQKCSKCSGEGIRTPEEFFEKEEHKFSKIIPKGIFHKETIIIENKGHEVPDCFKDQYPGQQRSNVVLIIDENREMKIDNNKFTRGVQDSMFNLAVEITLEPHEVICGTAKSITMLDGKKMCVKIPPGIIFNKQNNKVVVVPGLGMPYYKMKDRFGDLFVMINVDKELDLNDKKLSDIWEIMTGRSMNSDIKKTLESTKKKETKSLTVKEYSESESSKTTDKNNHDFKKMMRKDANAHSSDDDENDHEDGDHEMHGHPPGCATQ